MDDARLDKLTQKVGGRFKLTALVQRRMQELLSTEHPFGDPDIDNIFDNVLTEIEEGKISLSLTDSGRAVLEGDTEE